MHECCYGITYDNRELTWETLSSGDFYPRYKNNKGILVIGVSSDWIDRRKIGLAKHYKFCPYCGKKLDFKKIKEDLKKLDE